MNRSELVKTLELVKPALAATNMVPIFQCFTFNNGKVSAYDDTIAIIGPADVSEQCGLHGLTLLGLLSNSRAEELDLSLAGSTATLKIGKTVSKLPFDPPENFIFEEPKDKWAFKVPFTESLFEAIKLCLETVSTDATQAALLGITVQGDNMFSCNGDAVTRVHLKHGTGKHRVLMSTPFCEAILRLWSSLAVTKGALHFSPDWSYADFDDWSVYGRVLEIQDPIDFDALIKKTIRTTTETQALPDGFAEALARARVLADPESQKTVATLSKGKLELLTVTHMGEIRDALPMKGHHDVQANINASHLQRGIQSCDKIAFHDNCVVMEHGDDVLLLISNMS